MVLSTDRKRFLSEIAILLLFQPKASLSGYDAVSDLVESGVQWRSNFQIGSRVLKDCYKPILMHIYGMQCDFMLKSLKL